MAVKSARYITTPLVVALAAVSTGIGAAYYLYMKYCRKGKCARVMRRKIMRVPNEELPKLKNDLILRAIRGEKTERVPVWCMRQAGRHLPEFRHIRSRGYDFFTMCETPDICVEVTLQPVKRYKVDAAIIFSDILIIPQAMGMDLKMIPGVGPVFSSPIRNPSDIDTLDLTPNLEEKLGFLFDAINLTRVELAGEVPLIGFCGGPFTLMTYMIEGGGSPSKTRVRSWLYKHPQASHRLLQAITNVCVKLLISEERAGAQILQVFESVGAEILPPQLYYEFAFTYLSQVASRVKELLPSTPLIGFSKGTPYAYPRLADTKYDCLGVDWFSDPKEVRQLVNGKVTLQGNLDPAAIYAEPSRIREETRKMITSFGTQGYVANLGHGCFPDMDPHHVDTFIQSVKEISLELNQE